MRSVSIVFVALLFAFAPAPASAQASFTGVVRDTSGAVLPGVTVEAASLLSSRKSARPLPTAPDSTASSICGHVCTP